MVVGRDGTALTNTTDSVQLNTGEAALRRSAASARNWRAIRYGLRDGD